MKLWYFVDLDSNDAEQRGPVPESYLKDRAASGKFSADTPVWREGMDDWSTYAEVFQQSASQSVESAATDPQSTEGIISKRPEPQSDFKSDCEINKCRSMPGWLFWSLLGSIALIYAGLIYVFDEWFMESLNSSAAQAVGYFLGNFGLLSGISSVIGLIVWYFARYCGDETQVFPKQLSCKPFLLVSLVAGVAVAMIAKSTVPDPAETYLRQVDVLDAQLTSETYGYYYIVGKVRNDSPRELKTLNVVVFSYAQNGDVIDSKTVTIGGRYLNLSPGYSKSFSTYVGALKSGPDAKWSHEIHSGEFSERF